MNNVNNIVQKYSRTQIYSVTVKMCVHETVMLKILCKIFKDTNVGYSRTVEHRVTVGLGYMGKKIQFGCERSLSTESDNLWCQAIPVLFAQTVCMHAVHYVYSI